MPPAVILILVMFVITACEANFLNNSENQQFSLQQAKEYSLQNSTNFKMPSSVPLAKSTTGGVEYELCIVFKMHIVHLIHSSIGMENTGVIFHIFSKGFFLFEQKEKLQLMLQNKFMKV